MTQTSLRSVLTVGGWLFDLCTVAVAVVDVICDVLVAKQFYDDGHHLWGNLVLTTLLVSSVAIAITTMIASCRMWTSALGDPYLPDCADVVQKCLLRFEKLPMLVRFLLCVVFAQFLPLFQWIVMCAKTCAEKDAALGRIPDTINNQEEVGTSTRESEDRLVSEVEESNRGREEVVFAMVHAAGRHFEAHGLFYVEAIFESAPQCIIQLLAMTSLGTATHLQLVSLTLSLSSIVSKGYAISIAYDLRALIFRFALFAHDIFGLFYVFSSVLSTGEPKTWPAPAVLGGFMTGGVSLLWLYKVLGIAVVLFGVYIAYLVGLFQYARNSRNIVSHRVKEFAIGFVGGTAGFAILVVPLTLLLEALKLSVLNLVFFKVQPAHKHFPGYAKLFGFVYQPDRPDVNAEAATYADELVLGKSRTTCHVDSYVGRYKYAIYSYAMFLEECCLQKLFAWNTFSSHMPSLDSYESMHADDHRRLARRVRLAARPYQSLDSEPQCAAADRYGRLLKEYETLTSDQQPERSEAFEWQLCQEADGPGAVRMDGPLFFGRKVARRRVDEFWRAIVGRNGSKNGLLTFLCLAEVASITFGVVFPFLHVCSVGWSALNAFQHYCFSGVLISLIVAAFFFRPAWAYLCFNVDLYGCRDGFRNRIVFSPAHVWGIIKGFYRPPVTYSLLHSIDSACIPPDVISVVAEFLREGSIDTSSMSLGEARETRQLGQ